MKNPKETKLDKLWSLAIKKRDPFCRWNGCGYASIHAHHLYGRRARATRWLVINGIGLCATHHLQAHAKADDLWKSVQTYLSTPQLDELERLANSTEKYPNYEWIEQELKAFL